MTSRLIRYQLFAFVMVTVLGIGYAMTQYAGLEQILGFGQFHVAVQMPDTGGLYPGADVTENGVTVGRVRSVDVHGQGILARLTIDDGTRISADGLKAAVENTSAVGEQYLQLSPGTRRAPYLREGSVVPESEVTLPPSPTQLLDDLNSLLQSVPRQKLTITVDELYKTFNGSGPELRQLLASARNLVAAAQQNIAPTRSLINDLGPVLSTQAANSASIKDFSRSLAAVSARLSASNSDVAGTIAQGPGFTNELNALISQIQPTMPLLLANLTSVGRVLNVYLPGVRQSLVILPAAINNVDAATMDSGERGVANVDFVSTINNPPACQQGYSKSFRDPSETKPKPPPATAPHCEVASNSPQDVRGDRNNPCPNNPAIRSATAAGCGLYFGATASAAGAGSASGGSASPADAAGTYDPNSGLIVGPGGLLYFVGSNTVTGTGPATLKALLQQTLGT